jgi:hypothetical protein
LPARSNGLPAANAKTKTTATAAAIAANAGTGIRFFPVPATPVPPAYGEPDRAAEAAGTYVPDKSLAVSCPPPVIVAPPAFADAPDVPASAPQYGQNFASSLIGFPHFEQYFIVFLQPSFRYSLLLPTIARFANHMPAFCAPLSPL